MLARVKLESLEASAFKPVKEADLSHHLENGNSKNKEQKETNGKEVGSDSLDLKDYPLHEALTLLKGLSIMNK